MESDTIIALATPQGSSALALLRISGTESHRILSSLAAKNPRSGQTVYTVLCGSDGQVLDDVILNAWSRPASYTGEDLVEVSCHGNMLIVQRLIEEICQQGARIARPGEFTQRAFLNGKMDLTQAESVIDLINARTARALRAARALQAGNLGKKLELERENLLQILSHLEAYIDFPDEDIEPEVGQTFTRQIESTLDVLEKLLRSSREGLLLREGVKVALIGHPNAGKSSLMNALLERERSIVSPVAGTTRDTVEEVIQIEGIQIRLIDTAGLRSSVDEIEQLGIQRTRQAIKEADLLLWIQDGSLEEDELDAAYFPSGIPVLIALNKADLGIHGTREGLPVSSVKGTGLPELRHAIAEKLQLNDNAASNDEVVINTRHQELLEQATRALRQALAQKKNNTPPELISSDLREGLHALGEIIGQVSNEDILDRLFRNFCIGK